MNKNKNLLHYVDDRPGQDKRYAIKSNSIKRNLNFSHSIKFSQGLNDVITWYCENKNWWKNSLSSIKNPTPWKK